MFVDALVWVCCFVSYLNAVVWCMMLLLCFGLVVGFGLFCFCFVVGCCVLFRRDVVCF